jgi:hypothetical protein
MPISIIVAIALLVLRSITNARQVANGDGPVFNSIAIGLAVLSIVFIVQRKASGRTLARAFFGIIAVLSLLALAIMVFVGGALGAIVGGAATGGVGAAGGAALGMAAVTTIGGMIALFAAGTSIIGFVALGSDSARDYCNR